jgi:hypothetical protein
MVKSKALVVVAAEEAARALVVPAVKRSYRKSRRVREFHLANRTAIPTIKGARANGYVCAPARTRKFMKLRNRLLQDPTSSLKQLYPSSLPAHLHVDLRRCTGVTGVGAAAVVEFHKSIQAFLLGLGQHVSANCTVVAGKKTATAQLIADLFVLRETSRTA